MSISEQTTDGAGSRHFGVYPALVTDLVDLAGLGRIEVRFPWLGTDGDSANRAWATLLSPYADDDHGFEVLPEVGTQVVVGFEGGNLRRPYILGACWNGRQAMPVGPAAANDRRVIRSRSGSLLEFDDGPAGARLTVSLRGGNKVVLDDVAREVRVEHTGGHSIVLDVAGRITLTATAAVEVNAPVMNVHAATANFDGIINCTTMIASTAVVSPSYTPGAGNVW